MKNIKNKQLIFLFVLSLGISAAISAEKPKHHHHGSELTAEQKTCLEGKLGPKDSGTRPSKEAMEAAFTACGIEKPKGPPPGDQEERKPQSDNQESQATE